MTETQLKEKYKKEIEKIIKKIKKEYRPLKIFLFGSFVWGKFNPDSDLDLFIIKNTTKKKLDRIYEVYKLLWDKRIPLDILVYTPKEVKKRLEMGDFFIEDIIENGKLVYERKLRKINSLWGSYPLPWWFSRRNF
ncbi:MAG: nucleotidyltransferase domain-containing protein [Patescibacteria group bacterium]|nr:nucleotidyltransferase domain-containing protein [Patescibacteria group bacterium]